MRETNKEPKKINIQYEINRQQDLILMKQENIKSILQEIETHKKNIAELKKNDQLKLF